MQWFRLLDVQRGASPDRIRKAFRRKAARMHPDLGGDPAAFRLLGDARDAGLAEAELRATESDGGQPRRPPRPERGATRYRVLRLSVLDSIAGGVTRVDGVAVAYPPGVVDGQKIRLAGHGELSLSGGPRGDLCVEVAILPDPRWIRDDPHLIHVLPVTWIAAYRGDAVQLVGPWGRRYVSIPPGSSTGTRITILGAGLDGVGELRIVLDLIAPLPGQMDLEAALADARYPSGG